ncbi:MAG: glycine/betaine ABC transporter substrate-binding protein, partial [Oscillospiraceae bacterium]|nr:glycine/betaine ABC transporter substrate-binding protein [Oscillospiraceae bacterium]
MKRTIIALALSLSALLTLSACGRPAGDAGPIQIATKPMTEQYILGEMLGLILEDAGFEVEITKGIGGGTNNIHPAME